MPSVLIFWGVTVQRPSPGFLIPCKRARETSRAYYLDERLSLFPHPLRFAVFLIIKAASPAEPLVIRTTFFYCQLWFLLIFFSSRKKKGSFVFLSVGCCFRTAPREPRLSPGKAQRVSGCCLPEEDVIKAAQLLGRLLGSFTNSPKGAKERDCTQYRLYIAFPLITMFIHLMRRTAVYKRATHFQDAVIFRWANIKAPVSAKGVHRSVGKSITTTAPRAVLIHILLH